jgi:hypothetical protein
MTETDFTNSEFYTLYLTQLRLLEDDSTRMSLIIRQRAFIYAATKTDQAEKDAITNKAEQDVVIYLASVQAAKDQLAAALQTQIGRARNYQTQRNTETTISITNLFRTITGQLPKPIVQIATNTIGIRG